jgi:hypothetical protein
MGLGLGLCWFGFLGALLPTLGIVQHGAPILTADRYSYLPALWLGVPLLARGLFALSAGADERAGEEARHGPNWPRPERPPSREGRAALADIGTGSEFGWWRGGVVAAAVLALLARLIGQSHGYSLVWSDSVTLWRYAVCHFLPFPAILCHPLSASQLFPASHPHQQTSGQPSHRLPLSLSLLRSP